MHSSVYMCVLYFRSPVSPTKEQQDSQYEEIEFGKDEHKKRLTNGDATNLNKDSGNSEILNLNFVNILVNRSNENDA